MLSPRVWALAMSRGRCSHEAAAAVGGGTKEECAPPHTFEMDCDHPVFSFLRLTLGQLALLTVEGPALPGRE